MKPQELIRLMKIAENLKNNTRHSWTSAGRHESVAEHSFRLCFMALFLKDEFPDEDMDKVIRMCIIHDIGEAFTGDIPAFEKTGDDEKKEEDVVKRFVESLPEPYRAEFGELFEEMNALESEEAKIYKALDKMEAVIQHNEADISTWLPLEYELQMTYGEKEVAFSPYMKELKAAANKESKRKIEEEKERDSAGVLKRRSPAD